MSKTAGNRNDLRNAFAVSRFLKGMKGEQVLKLWTQKQTVVNITKGTEKFSRKNGLSKKACCRCALDEGQAFSNWRVGLGKR